MKQIIRVLLLIIPFMAGLKANAQPVYGLTTGNQMFSVDNINRPSAIINLAEVTGLAPGEQLQAIDMQPGTGELFGLTYDALNNVAALYNIDINGPGYLAVAVNPSIPMQLGNAPNMGFDFNPVNNSEIFITGSNGNVYILDAASGDILFIGGSIFYAQGDINSGNTPVISAIAHTNNFWGADNALQYGYDINNNVLVQFDRNVNATVHTIGLSGLSVDDTSPVGMDSYFDTVNFSTILYMTAKPSAAAGYSFVTIDQATGQARIVGTMPRNIEMRDIALNVHIPIPLMPTGPVITGLTRNRRNLVFFDAHNPSVIRDVKQIVGVSPGQEIIAIDYRPFDLDLYALGYNNTNTQYQVYRIDISTGVAMPVNATPEILNLGIGPDVTASFDFNPFADRIHVIGSNGISYQLSPSTGLLLNTDKSFSYAPTDVNTGSIARVSAIAYTNSYFNAGLSQRMGIDYANGTLISFTGQDFTTLKTTASLANILDTSLYVNGFMDIYYSDATQNNMGYLATNSSGYRQSYLYSIEPLTGHTVLLGEIGPGIPLMDIAAQLTYTGATVEDISDLPLAAEGVYVYPNPVNDRAKVLLSSVAQRRVSVTILDYNGNILLSRVYKPGGNLVNIDVSNIPSGMYSLKVQEQGSKPESVKLVKQ